MTGFIVADGQWVSEKFERLASLIQDYDASLELRWIPPVGRTREDKEPYVIWDTRTDTSVLFAKEQDEPHQILARLWGIDNVHNNVLDKIEIEENAKKALDMKAWMDKQEEAADLAYFFKQSPLHTIKHNGKKFDHNRRRIE